MASKFEKAFPRPEPAKQGFESTEEHLHFLGLLELWEQKRKGALWALEFMQSKAVVFQSSVPVKKATKIIPCIIVDEEIEAIEHAEKI